MRERRNDYDVTNQRQYDRPAGRLRGSLPHLPGSLPAGRARANLAQAFTDLARLYRGEYPGFHECDTDYHDVQHVLDVTLGMARLMDGCVRATSTETITERLFRFGIITALYHDCGYIRHRKDTKHANGAEYTAVHVSRGARFLEEYLPKIGMADLAAGRRAHRALHRLRDPGGQDQGAGPRVPPDRQPAGQRRHPGADGRPLLPREVLRPALPGVRARRHRPQAPQGRQRGGRIRLGRRPDLQDAALLPGRDQAAEAGPGRLLQLRRSSTSAARTSTSTSSRRTSVTPARSRSKATSPCCAGVRPGPTRVLTRPASRSSC